MLKFNVCNKEFFLFWIVFWFFVFEIFVFVIVECNFSYLYFIEYFWYSFLIMDLKELFESFFENIFLCLLVNDMMYFIWDSFLCIWINVWFCSIMKVFWLLFFFSKLCFLDIEDILVIFNLIGSWLINKCILLFKGLL